MTVNVGAQPGKIKAYGLVRDKNGRPKVDDVTAIPPEVWETLSEEDKRYLLNGNHPCNSSS